MLSLLQYTHIDYNNKDIWLLRYLQKQLCGWNMPIGYLVIFHGKTLYFHELHEYLVSAVSVLILKIIDNYLGHNWKFKFMCMEVVWNHVLIILYNHTEYNHWKIWKGMNSKESPNKAPSCLVMVEVWMAK